MKFVFIHNENLQLIKDYSNSIFADFYVVMATKFCNVITTKIVGFWLTIF
jgi:hypothetical protein